MQDIFPMPSCFSSAAATDDPAASDDCPASTAAAANKLGQSVVVLLFRTKIAGQCGHITITWCRNLLARGLSISIDGDRRDLSTASCCKVEMRPWHFWRRHGTKRLHIDGGKLVDVFWDLRKAKFCDDDHSSPEPLSDYYVAVVSDEEVVLLLGDLKKEAYRKTGSPPSVIDAMLVSKKEHVFGKKRFVTRAKFHEKGRFHEVAIECNAVSAPGRNADSEMVIKIDGSPAVHVRHLQWKFRGNEIISVSKVRVEVYWDVHGWLFSPSSGFRQALFIFKPTAPPPPLPSSSSSLSSLIGDNGCSDFCLFLHAWKVE